METPRKFDNIVEHIAGIIPVASPPLEFKMPWHDSLMPIAPDYLAVERSVYECLKAGCSTIWIICHVGMQPLIRSRIGDMYVHERFVDYAENRHDRPVCRRVNIFYVPVHPKDRDRRDSLGWSALYGADIAYRICAKLSRWVVPEKFYCTFPYGIVPLEFIQKSRPIIRGTKQVIISYQGKTVKDGLYTSFTFDAEWFKKCRDYVKLYASEKRQVEENDRLPIYAPRHLSLDKIFSPLELDKAEIIEAPYYYDISTWNGYVDMLGAKLQIDSPRRNLIKFTRNRISDDISNTDTTDGRGGTFAEVTQDEARERTPDSDNGRT